MSALNLEGVETYSHESILAERSAKMWGYLDGLNDADSRTAEVVLDDILPGKPPLANTAVIIPVAAHQEAANIEHTLALYAAQRVTSPFTVVLGLNNPIDTDRQTDIRASHHAIKRALARHPDLDVRVSHIEYGNPVIGEIRRDLWNGVLMSAVRRGGTADGRELIAVNHDIDQVSMRSDYIARIQAHYAWRESRHILAAVSQPVYTQTKHAYDPEHHNISRTVLWSDFVYRTVQSGFEAGSVIPMTYYAAHGGITATDRTHEVGRLIRADNRHHRRIKMLPGTNNETSLRRYVARMASDGYDIWSGDSFGSSDICRDTLHQPDIARERQLEIVARDLPHHTSILIGAAITRAESRFWSAAPDDIFRPGRSQDEITASRHDQQQIELTRAARHAAGVLLRVIDHPPFEKRLLTLMDPAVLKSLSA